MLDILVIALKGCGLIGLLCDCWLKLELVAAGLGVHFGNVVLWVAPG